MPHSAASDLGLHCLHMSYKKDARLIWVKGWFEHLLPNIAYIPYFKDRYFLYYLENEIRDLLIYKMNLPNCTAFKKAWHSTFPSLTQNVTQVTLKFMTDQFNEDLACDIVPQTELHMFNLPKLMRGNLTVSGFNYFYAK